MKPSIERLESRACPSTVAIVTIGRVPLPSFAQVRYPGGRPEIAEPGWADEARNGVAIVHRLAPRAHIVSVQFPEVKGFDVEGIAAAAGRYAEVVVMPWAWPAQLPDIGLFATTWAWKYTHPDTIYVAAAGDSAQVRSPASYHDVLAAGVPNAGAQGFANGKHVPEVVAAVRSTSESSFVWGARAARVVDLYGRMDTDGFRAYLSARGLLRA